MLSFVNLGKYGRLGNQMFQYAALKGIAKNNKFNYCIPISHNLNPYTDHQLLQAFEMRDVLVSDGKSCDVPNNKRFNERFYHFDADLFMSCEDNIDLLGYFQSYKYFDGIKDELFEDFKFKNIKSIPEEDYISVHIRRTDYIEKSSHHPVYGEEYYVPAMESFGKNEKFVVVSDDIDWCKKQDFFKNYDVLFWQGSDNVHDLYVLTKSKHNIIANSSFSWWGAYLNNNLNKTVIFPKQWYGPELIHQDTSDLTPTDWISL